MHNENKNKKTNDPVPEAEVLRASKNGMPSAKNGTIAERIRNENASQNVHGADKRGTFSGDPSEMRKAPGYNGSVPGVNTPEIRLPGAEMKSETSVPAFNPPVPNRAWTAMRMGMDITELSEEEKRDLYVGRDRLF